MPTGYTAPIKDGISFEHFVLQCARAMGACIMQRDDRLGPELAVDTVSDYSIKSVADAEAEVERLKALQPEQIDAEYRAEVAKAEADLQRDTEERTDLRTKYRNMRTRVSQWNPPTSEHANLKKFMLEQIDSSIDWDCNGGTYYSDRLQKLVSQTPVDWFAEKRVQSIQALARAKQYLVEEQERTDARNEWKRQLCKSLGVPEPQSAA